MSNTQSTTTKLTVRPAFTCEYEVHDRAAFQAGGHFVPSNCTGDEVHCLNLLDPTTGRQILRTMGPDAIAVYDLMGAAIASEVWNNSHAATIRDYTYEQFQNLVQERGQLSLFLQDVFPYAAGDTTNPVHASVALLKHYARSTTVRVRAAWYRYTHKLPAPKGLNHWLPENWRS